MTSGAPSTPTPHEKAPATSSISAQGPLLVAGAAVLWGMWSLSFRTAERLSSTPLSGGLETFLVFVVMFVVALPFAVRSSRSNAPARTWKAWALLAVMGVTDGTNGLCFFTAMQHTTIAVAVLLHYLQPLLTAAAAPFVLGEPLRARTFAALGVALAGLALLLQPWSSSSSGVFSAVLFSATVVLGKKVSPSFTVAELACYPKVTSIVALAFALPATGLAIEAKPLAAVVAGGLVFGSLSLVMFFRGLTSTTASQAGVLTLCEPLVAVIVGALWWDEVPGPLAVVGGALVLGGAAWMSLPSPSRSPPPPTQEEPATSSSSE